MDLNKNLIKQLQNLMYKYNIDTYIVTKTDPHQSEYVDEHFNYVKFISGFSGSYATLVVRREESFLFTDGRYYIQAKKELNNTKTKIYYDTNIDFLTFSINKTKKNETLCFNSKTMNVSNAKFLINKCKENNINLNYNLDLIKILWKNRPTIKINNLLNLDISYCGMSVEEKIKNIKTKIKKYDCNFYFISSLDDIAWLFNIRSIGKFSSFNFYAYTIITCEETILFINYNKKDNNIIENLKSNNIIIKNYEDIFNYIKNINIKNIKILINPSKTNFYIYEKLSSLYKNIKIKEIEHDITSLLKSVKNNIEVSNIKIANIKYSIALFKLIKWLKETVSNSNITEFDIENKLNSIRKEDKNYLCPSFKTISAYNENSAIVHYNTKENNSKILKNSGLLLLDSGANYLEGTTDITRTILLGNANKEIKKYYTLVLKGLISLSKAKFLYGSTGSNLDVLARIYLWNFGYDYKHGTGHGIGFCLNVHEGPQRISLQNNNIILEENMLLSNEPGIYIENKFGIRLENNIIVKYLNTTDFGKFMCFETLSFIPFEIEAIDTLLLTKEEKEWINNYHENTYKKLSSYLNKEEKIYLKHITQKI